MSGFDIWYDEKFAGVGLDRDGRQLVLKGLLREAWNAGWQKGYDQGKYDPDFENDDEI